MMSFRIKKEEKMLTIRLQFIHLGNGLEVCLRLKLIFKKPEINLL